MIKLSRLRWFLLSALVVLVLSLGSYTLYSYAQKESPKKGESKESKQPRPEKVTPRAEEAPSPKGQGETEDVPSVPNSTETSSSISRDQEGTRFGSSAYETESSAEEVIAWYEQQLPSEGWVLVNTSAVKNTIVSVYQKGSDRLIIKATGNTEQGKTSVTLSFNPR